MSLAGNYTIFSALSQTNFLSIPVFNNFLNAPVVVREPLSGPPDNGNAQVWEILPAGGRTSNLYTVTLRSLNAPITIQNGRLLVNFVSGAADPATFSVEPAGSNQYHFHVPDQDSVWTVGADSGNPAVGSPVELESLGGLQSQIWSLVNALD